MSSHDFLGIKPHSKPDGLVAWTARLVPWSGKRLGSDPLAFFCRSERSSGIYTRCVRRGPSRSIGPIHPVYSVHTGIGPSGRPEPFSDWARASSSLIRRCSWSVKPDRIGDRFQNPDEHARVPSWRFSRVDLLEQALVHLVHRLHRIRERATDRLSPHILAAGSGRPSDPTPMPGSDCRETGTSVGPRPPRGRAFPPSSWLGIDYGCALFSHFLLINIHFCGCALPNSQVISRPGPALQRQPAR